MVSLGQAVKALYRTTFTWGQMRSKPWRPSSRTYRQHGLKGELRLVSHYGKRGRPSKTAAAVTVQYVVEGALVSSLAYRQTVWDAKSCFILTTRAL